jgi:hypothetical protein
MELAQSFVPVPDAEIFCQNLARNGWLTAEPRANGDVAYAWAAKAEAALNLRALLDSAEGREN